MATVADVAHSWAGLLPQTREAMAVARGRARRDGVATNEVMAGMFLAVAEAEVGERHVAHGLAERTIALAAARGLDHHHRGRWRTRFGRPRARTWRPPPPKSTAPWTWTGHSRGVFRKLGATRRAQVGLL